MRKAPSTIAGEREPPHGDDRRSAPLRAPIGRVSTLRTGDHMPRDVLVEDLSEGGFRFSANDRLPVGARVRIGLAGGGVSEARIVRIGDGDYGCAFVHALTQEQRLSAFASLSVTHAAFGGVIAARPTAGRGRRKPLLHWAGLSAFSAGVWSGVVWMIRTLG